MAFHGSADSAGTPARPAGIADDTGGGRMRKLGSLRTLWPFLARHRGLFSAWLLALAVSGKMVALDCVEYNPARDSDGSCCRTVLGILEPVLLALAAKP